MADNKEITDLIMKLFLPVDVEMSFQIRILRQFSTTYFRMERLLTEGQIVVCPVTLIRKEIQE